MDYSVPRTVLDASPQVFRWRAGDEAVWVKKRRRAKNPLGWWAQRLVYRLTGMLLAVPSARPPGDAVRFESDKLSRLGGLGVRVPRVLHVGPDYFVMTDTGVTLEHYLGANPDSSREFIDKAARELRALHGLGVAHGGAQIKNLTVRGGDIHFIDFEERVPDERLREFQLRDLFLFILSLERTGHDPDLASICRSYGGGENGESLEAIRRALLQLWPARLMDWGPFLLLSMRDIRCLCRLIRKAEALHPVRGAA